MGGGASAGHFSLCNEAIMGPARLYRSVGKQIADQGLINSYSVAACELWVQLCPAADRPAGSCAEGGVWGGPPLADHM